MPAERSSRTSRVPGFGRALLLALFAGLGALPWQLLFGAPWSYEASLARYQLVLTVLAVIAVAPSWRAGLSAGMLGALLCAALGLLAPADIAVATLGALCVLGLTRSALCDPRPFARAVFHELLLAFPATGAFALLYDGRPVGNAAAVWAFWLVQSAFPLLPGSTPAREPPARDRFEAAMAAAEQLMR